MSRIAPCDCAIGSTSTPRPQRGDRRRRNVLVGQQSRLHASASGRLVNRRVALVAHHLGGKRERRQNVVARDVRVRLQQLLESSALRQPAQYQLDRNPRALDGGLAEQDRGVRHDAISPVRHGSLCLDSTVEQHCAPPASNAQSTAMGGIAKFVQPTCRWSCTPGGRSRSAMVGVLQEIVLSHARAGDRIFAAALHTKQARLLMGAGCCPAVRQASSSVPSWAKAQGVTLRTKRIRADATP